MDRQKRSFESITDHTHTQTTTAKRRDTTIDIHALNIDVMQYIFSDMIPHKDWASISRVSKYWRTIALQSFLPTENDLVVSACRNNITCAMSIMKYKKFASSPLGMRIKKLYCVTPPPPPRPGIHIDDNNDTTKRISMENESDEDGDDDSSISSSDSDAEDDEEEEEDDDESDCISGDDVYDCSTKKDITTAIDDRIEGFIWNNINNLIDNGIVDADCCSDHCLLKKAFNDDNIDTVKKILATSKLNYNIELVKSSIDAIALFVDSLKEKRTCAMVIAEDIADIPIYGGWDFVLDNLSKRFVDNGEKRVEKKMESFLLASCERKNKSAIKAILSKCNIERFKETKSYDYALEACNGGTTDDYGTFELILSFGFQPNTYMSCLLSCRTTESFDRVYSIISSPKSKYNEQIRITEASSSSSDILDALSIGRISNQKTKRRIVDYFWNDMPIEEQTKLLLGLAKCQPNGDMALYILESFSVDCKCLCPYGWGSIFKITQSEIIKYPKKIEVVFEKLYSEHGNCCGRSCEVQIDPYPILQAVFDTKNDDTWNLLDKVISKYIPKNNDNTNKIDLFNRNALGESLPNAIILGYSSKPYKATIIGIQKQNGDSIFTNKPINVSKEEKELIIRYVKIFTKHERFQHTDFCNSFVESITTANYNKNTKRNEVAHILLDYMTESFPSTGINFGPIDIRVLLDNYKDWKFIERLVSGYCKATNEVRTDCGDMLLELCTNNIEYKRTHAIISIIADNAEKFWVSKESMKLICKHAIKSDNDRLLATMIKIKGIIGIGEPRKFKLYLKACKSKSICCMQLLQTEPEVSEYMKNETQKKHDKKVWG
jgi:hypothetical protein